MAATTPLLLFSLASLKPGLPRSAFTRSAASFIAGTALVSAQPRPAPADTNAALADVRVGMRQFRTGDVAGSIEAFDRALQAEPALDPYLWQRGISLYYAGRYADAAAQFARDVAVNPNDTEEAVWNLLARSRVEPGGLRAARQDVLKIGPDRRAVMGTVLAAFTGDDAAVARLEQIAAGTSAGEAYYAALYRALFAEATGDAAGAREWMARALEGPYAMSPGGQADYMVSVAQVHTALRLAA